MFKFDIAAIISAVRSPRQFAALVAILIFLSLLVLRLGPDQRSAPEGGAGQSCSARKDRLRACDEGRITLEYGRRLH